MTRWSTLLLDDAPLGVMPNLPANAVLGYADAVAGQRPHPRALYERWERQQWSAPAINLEADQRDFARMPKRLRKPLEESIATFIIGEYTGLELLGPILTGAPEEDDLLYLGTQVADETRHTQMMLRLGEELLGLDPTPQRMLTQAWDLITAPHRDLSVLEAEVIRDLDRKPGDYRLWLRAVALFHFITEGVLAVVGQRAIIHSLSSVRRLPGVKAAFTAMCRDESRHLSYGLHALRIGVREGYADDICEVIEKAAPLALRIAIEDTPQGIALKDLTIASLRRQIRLVEIDDAFADHVIGLAADSRDTESKGDEHARER